MSHQIGGGGHDPPPIYAQQEMFAPAQPFRFYPLDLGLALGVAAAVFMLLAMLVAIAGNNAEGLRFFQTLFPGFTPAHKLSIVIGLAWSFVYGGIAGFATGVLYNWRMNRISGSSHQH
jgi:hypothetical protein